MGLFSNAFDKLQVIVSGVKFEGDSKKPCTEEEKQQMIELLQGYQVSNFEKQDKPIDFGSVLRIGDEMKKILKEKKINPTCYLETTEEENYEKGSVERNGKCIKDENCEDNLVCMGYIKNLSPGTCLDPKYDSVDIAKIVAFGNVCEDQRECSIKTQCSSKDSTFTTNRKCMSINFPLKDEDGFFIEKIVLYDII